MDNILIKEKKEKTVPFRTYKGPPDDFYKGITPERHEFLIKQIRLKGSGNLDIYRDEYSNFLDKQLV